MSGLRIQPPEEPTPSLQNIDSTVEVARLNIPSPQVSATESINSGIWRASQRHFILRRSRGNMGGIGEPAMFAADGCILWRRCAHNAQVRSRDP